MREPTFTTCTFCHQLHTGNICPCCLPVTDDEEFSARLAIHNTEAALRRFRSDEAYATECRELLAGDLHTPAEIAQHFAELADAWYHEAERLRTAIRTAVWGAGKAAP